MPGSSPLFEDITVVEIGQYVAAPYAAELLAHGGANVISIEPVDGGPTRHNSPLGSPGDGRHYITKARGKQALPCSLSSDDGQRVIQALVAEADVLITNLRPGAADEIGLGWDQLHAELPGLIYATVSGFGDHGPLAHVACVDIVAQAESGLTASLGRREEGHFVSSDVLIADYSAGSLLAFAIASALRHRDRTGRGQKVTTSLLASTLTAQHRRASRVAGIDDWHDEFAEQRSSGSLEDVMEWREDQIGQFPFFYNVYAVADGEVAIGAVAVNGQKLLTIAGLDPSELEAPARLRGMSIGETTDLVRATLAHLTVSELVTAARKAGIPAGRVRFLEEAMADPDLREAGLFQVFDHPRLGEVVMPAPPVTFSDAGYEPGTTTPAYGQHTDSLLRELGYDDEVIERLVADGIVGRTFPARPDPTADSPSVKPVS